MTDYTDLIARLEAASGPDRALDWDITVAIGLVEIRKWHDLPAYTGSLDAALTLVPEMHHWMIDASNPPIGQSQALVRSLTVGASVTARSVTAPIALCIAALRARSEPNQPKDV